MITQTRWKTPISQNASLSNYNEQNDSFVYLDTTLTKDSSVIDEIKIKIYTEK